MKSCELCKSAARMYCESDLASLCWDCDAKVHSANFLVARHSRSLLCHVCQSPTAWNASGSKLGRTVSVCESCVSGGEKMKEIRGGEEEIEAVHDGESDTEVEYDGDDADDDDDEDDENQVDEEGVASADEDDGDNQVVPWSLTTPPPPASSSSSSEESSSRFCNSEGAVSLKRLRSDASDLRSDDDYSCSSSHRNHTSAAAVARDNKADFADSSRPLKRLTTEGNRSATVQRGPVCLRTAAILESLERFHEVDLTSGDSASAAIVRICNLSKDPETVD